MIVIDNGLQMSAYIAQRAVSGDTPAAVIRPNLLSNLRSAAWAATLSNGNRAVLWTHTRMMIMTTEVWSAERHGK